MGLHIYDFLACYPGKVEGVVFGFAKSIAVVILQACSVRKCLPHSKILIHHLFRKHISLDVMRDEKKRTETLQEMERDQSFLYEILAKRTKKSVEAIRMECEKDEDMDAKTAMAFGLIDEIVPERKS